MKKRYIQYSLIIVLCVLLTFVGVTDTFAKSDVENVYSAASFDGTKEEEKEMERLLMAKLVYTNIDSYKGMTVRECVNDIEDFSDEIWDGSGLTYQTVYGSLIGDWEIFEIYDHNDTTGFYAVAFMKDDQVVFTFRGSEMFTENFPMDDSNDWTGTDFKFAIFNELSKQFDDADACLKDLKKQLSKRNIKAEITLAGHSLGGALVTYESLVSGLQGYSFDGAAGHVVDIVLYYNYLDVELFDGAASMPFVNYTDVIGFPVADLIQHTNAENMRQIDRETRLKDLNEYTLIPKYSTGGSHIAWTTLAYEENVISLSAMKDEDGDGYTYFPENAVCMDITQNVIDTIYSDYKDEIIDITNAASSLFGLKQEGRVMLASESGNVLRAYDGIGVDSAFSMTAVMYGGCGDDELYGYTGDDVLIPGRGNDLADGGLGNDIYVVDSNFGSLKIRDYGGKKTTIILRNMNIYTKNDIAVSTDSIELRNGKQKIDIDIRNNNSLEIYAYYNGKLKKLDVINYENTSDKYIVFLEGKGELSFYDGDSVKYSVDDYNVSNYETEYIELDEGYAIRNTSDGNESILLVMDSPSDVRVSNYDARVNMALAIYNCEKGIISNERKYNRKFTEYEIDFSEHSLDDGGEGEYNWTDIIHAGLTLLFN